MARQPRLDLPGIPQHIVQRGNNRLPCFLDDVDRIHYLELLGEALLVTGVRLHAYVLMDNHVHLLGTPPEGRGGPNGADDGPKRRPPVQRASRANRHAVGRTLQILPGRRCRLIPSMRSLHRP